MTKWKLKAVELLKLLKLRAYIQFLRNLRRRYNDVVTKTSDGARYSTVYCWSLHGHSYNVRAAVRQYVYKTSDFDKSLDLRCL
jgi:hypothetical protein